MNNGTVCKLKKEFFSENKIKEMNKKDNRIYLYLTIKYKNLYFLIPFESNLFQKNKKAIYPMPTKDRPKAGINFEKVIILKNTEHIIEIKDQDLRIPKPQKNIITNDIKNINQKFERYIENFINACNKKREKQEYAYKFSTLHHYKTLLTENE
ncbi:hypothetical protein [Staphylococcus sp. GDY8P57P]|uniref:hypothetical protein n=1 Tax=Staphylococcus sp. GDY8P57P TaxID=2804128 RepID=UPI0018883F73|nr:hypothetical protein [Staphylococcus sp. GDY8P57P]MBF2758190.1 hypothetical protein [Staphylococcus haemolyticus]MBF2773081.1 hypothetical protein [Staphylococcus haemolyticus]MBF2774970.1 hypothetical protein [Staphylococcus haemolyticus]MBF2816784.1 hypothetical protein [Staphylococcus haemolyticus]MBF9720284.1 hypothetical protein [Staphylococcus haemolyticus]